jgi:glycosyltransferase involved in cell wall biosynthesis
METLRSVIFDSRFLDKNLQSGIARDSKAIHAEFIKNEWSVNLLKYKAIRSARGDAKASPAIQLDRSLARATAEASIIGKALKATNLEATYFYLSQISPIKVDTNNSSCQRIIRIHDLFPITNPDWFTTRARLHFKAGLNSISPHDLLITNSRTTTESLLRVMKGRISREQVHEIPCPSTDFESSIPCNICEMCANAYPINDYFLAVGTIEPRKNYVNLLTAWEKSTPNNSGFKLVIVGNLGWHDKDIKRHLDGQKNVLHLKGICDYQLYGLYKNTFAFVSASLNEGFNIPLHEAQSIGSRLVLSDIEIHQEFATDNTAAWFDPMQAASMTRALNDAFNNTLKIPGKASDHSFEDQFKHFLFELSIGRSDA